MADMRPRRLKRSPVWNREERRKHVESQAASGLSVQDYCLAHALSIRAFCNRVRMEARLQGLLRPGTALAPMTPTSLT